ncbi:MAG: hypothetical protein IJA72_02795 [Clostridia bacterium]|nr:hypothetical protein [Clostridia bacterium]
MDYSISKQDLKKLLAKLYLHMRNNLAIILLFGWGLELFTIFNCIFGNMYELSDVITMGLIDLVASLLFISGMIKYVNYCIKFNKFDNVNVIEYSFEKEDNNIKIYTKTNDTNVIIPIDEINEIVKFKKFSFVIYGKTAKPVINNEIIENIRKEINTKERN